MPKALHFEGTRPPRSSWASGPVPVTILTRTARGSTELAAWRSVEQFLVALGRALSNLEMARRRRHPARSVATRAFQILCCSLISGWVGLLKMLHSSGMHWHAATRRFGSRCPSPAGSGPSGESCCLHSVTPPAPAAANLKSESRRRIQDAGARPRSRDYDASPFGPGTCSATRTAHLQCG